ncbi:MAG TPA: acyl-CoA dehydrogenase family protein [Tepidisphaeraceae bacterium]|nr:acyl-CoA dehydrogenase family protein [Tepidisphaeraceae bacterium]
MHTDAELIPAAILEAIAGRAESIDQSGQWPQQDLDDLRRVGLTRWAVPVEYGGLDRSALQQHLGYEQLARASLAVALIVSQGDAAIGLIEGSQSDMRSELLPRLAAGELFSTVGIAQLTTSRQSGPPVLRAIREHGGYRLEGLIPWCTGAAHAQYIVVGAVTEDARQLLVLLPTQSKGVRIDPPLPLVALRSTWTTSVHCERVMVEDRFVLRGPGEKLLGRRNHLPLGQAFLAMGLCQGALDLILAHTSAAAQAAHARLHEQLIAMRGRILELSVDGSESEATGAAPEIRGQCNDLAVRATHAAVALYKGTALLAGHPAQRLAREAMFLLVWSCPNPVIDCTVEMLTA